jgi:polyketide biosynthesis enoyl-CoA hydratase PksI
LVATQVTPPLAVIRLQDAAGRNRISAALERRLADAFDAVVGRDDVRAIVLEGLPDVFCAGGTPEDLAGLTGRRSVDKWPFVRTAADCPLPVVAAVQGHAIGGGLLLALYADVTVLSEDASYAANFISYGFTPCLGATHILPARLGAALGAELLLTGRAVRGRELARRGAGCPVVASERVTAHSHDIANRIALAPRRSLELLKALLAEPARREAEAALARELPGHLETFASPWVRDRVSALYQAVE